MHRSPTACLLLLVVACTAACAAPPHVAPQLPLAKIAGGHIVYSRVIMKQIAGTTAQIPIKKLFVMDGAGGGNKAPFFTPPEYTTAHEARWSPDFGQLIFSSDLHNERSALMQDIFRAKADGTVFHRVTGNEAPATAARGTIRGRIVDNVQRESYQQPTGHSVINITASGVGKVIHPNPDMSFTLPGVAAADETWIKVWLDKNTGNVVTRKVTADTVNDVGNIELRGLNLLAGRGSVGDNSRYLVGIGEMVQMEKRAPNPIDDRGGTQIVKGGASSITLYDLTRRGMLCAAFKQNPFAGDTAKDPVMSPNGQVIACSWGQASIENLALVSVQSLLADQPQPKVLVQGGRIFPSEMNGFLTANVSNNSPAWSSDGARIVFAQTYMGTTFTTGEIFTVNANGSGVRQLTHTRPDQLCTQPCFSPDGKRIAFVILQGKAGPIAPEQLIALQFTADIYTMNADGSNIKRLTTDGLSAEPAWGP
jgi:hypothetical protein